MNLRYPVKQKSTFKSNNPTVFNGEYVENFENAARFV